MCQGSTSHGFAKCGTILTLGQESLNLNLDVLSSWNSFMSHAILLHLLVGLCRPCVLLCIIATDSHSRCQRECLTLACAWKRWTTSPASVPVLDARLRAPSQRHKWFLTRHLTDVQEAQGGCVLPGFKKHPEPEANRGSHLPSSFPPSCVCR